MESKENLLAVLSSRRRANFKNQFKSVVLEGFEIFGPEIVEEVMTECKAIYLDFIKLSEENPSTHE